ncbi:reticulon-3 isoform X3 [Engraulis encrasicolus]|uniref:reticulon-3 isoform X3 n=1 Tax=Engraulis encrasicolus TaxID=184585 RepID=UPI002FD67172
MADTQSSQISSSQGLADGQNSAKDSKFTDSFFSSSPVSLIQSPQDKRVVVGSDKPAAEGVAATSLRFQPGSFTPMNYSHDSSSSSYSSYKGGAPEKRATAAGAGGESCSSPSPSDNSSSLTSPQEDSPIKMSPVSERIKALEALAGKKNEPQTSVSSSASRGDGGVAGKKNEPQTSSSSRGDSGGGGFPHFRERHYEKPAVSIVDVPAPVPPPPAAFQKKVVPPMPEKESPESPFEVLGDTVPAGTDFEDTADWMRAHLPPAPNFGTDDVDVDVRKIGAVTAPAPAPTPTPAPSLKGRKEEPILAPAVPAEFAGVPDAFMDTPIEPPNLKNVFNPEKQENLEEEAEFDLNFLPTAYMWEKQDDNAADAGGASGQPPAKESDIGTAPSPTTAPPPAGFGSPSPPFSPPSSPPASPPRAKVPKNVSLKTGDSHETHEMDSSGDSDDTVIEDACAASKANSAPAAVAVEKEKEPVPTKPPLQVPIINVIETEEQVVSEEEYGVEEMDEEELERHRAMRDPPRNQEPVVSESEVKKDGPTTDTADAVAEDDNKSAEQSPQVFMTESSDSHSTQQPSYQDGGSGYGTVQPPLRSLFRAESEDIVMDYRDYTSFDQDDGMDAFSNINNPTQERSQKERPKYEAISEDDYMPDDFSKPTVPPNANSPISQSSRDRFSGDSVPSADEASNDRQLNFATVPEASPSDYASDTCIETMVSQNIYNVGIDNSKTTEDSRNVPLMADDNYAVDEPSMQEFAQDDFSYYNEQPDSFPDMTHEDLGSNQDAKGVSSGVSAGNAKGLEKSEPPVPTDSFVEFMRECIQARQDEDPDPLRQIRTTPTVESSPAAVRALEQESNTIRALKELGSSQEEEEDDLTKKKTMSSKPKTSKQEKNYHTQPQTEATSNPTPSSGGVVDSSAGGGSSESSLCREVEAIDILVAEAFYLAEHVLTAILTHLSVKDLVYWRDPKKSGVVFGVSMLLLLSLAAFSVISVVSYLLLALLCVTISFRIYKSVVQAVQKSGDGHPFKAFMEKDVSVPPETFRKHVDTLLTYVNKALKQMSRLFLVEDLVDSLKLAVGMWLLTYVGAVFNGITLLILADILIFTMPLVYEKNKTQIDKYVDIARTQINTTMAKLQEKLPASMKRSKTE